ncbi:MAG: hypothetical protein AB7V40_00605 [Methyloceanibacter sp.]
MRQDTAKQAEPHLEPALIERERNRLGARALAILIILNGAAALVLLSILGRAPVGSVDNKMATAMLFFSGGAVAALLSSFLAYLNRTIALEAPERRDWRRGLQIIGIVAVVGSAAAFLTGMNMVAAAASERSSSHPKGAKEQERPKGDASPTAQPSERVEVPAPVGASSLAIRESGEPA